MPCMIDSGDDFKGIQCGSGFKYLPMDYPLHLGQELGYGPMSSVYMGRLEISDSFKEEEITVQQLEDLALGWPGQKFSIEILSMMSDLRYERVGAGKWERVKNSVGMAGW